MSEVKPKGTIGHHVGVLDDVGLIEVVRTKKVRAIEAKYYGRTARTYLLTPTAKLGVETELAPDHFLTRAATEYAQASNLRRYGFEKTPMSTLRHARIPEDKAAEWAERLYQLAQEFVSEPRGGEITYGLLLALYPTDRPHLPDKDPE